MITSSQGSHQYPWQWRFPPCLPQLNLNKYQGQSQQLGYCEQARLEERYTTSDNLSESGIFS